MNNVNLVGRLTRDPEIRYTQSDNPMCIARFSTAVERRFKREGEQTADFVSCVAFGKIAETIEKYCHKGIKIGIVGRLQTGSYENKEGQRVYTTDVIVENFEFVESKASSGANANNEQATASAPASDDDGFMNIPEGMEEDLPF